MKNNSPEITSQQSGNKTISERIIKQIEPSPFSFSWNRVFTYLETELKNTPLPLGRILFFTDGQPIEFEKKEYEKIKNDYSQTDFLWIKSYDEEINNIRIDSAVIVNPHQTPGAELLVNVFIDNQNKNLEKEIHVDMFINQKRAAQEYTKLAKGGKGTVTFSIRLPEIKNYSIKFEIPQDDYEADNEYFLTYSPAKELNILIIEGENTDSKILSKALRPSETNNYLNIEIKKTKELNYLNEKEIGLILLNQVTDYSNFIKTSLKKLVLAGTPIILIPDLANELTKLNKDFFDYFQLGIQAQGIETAQEKEYFSTRPKNGKNSFSSLEDPEYWKKIKVYQKIKTLISSAAELETFLIYDDNQPAVFMFPVFNSSIIILTFNLESKSSNLIYHPMIVPFIHELIHYSAYAKKDLIESNYNVNQPVKIRERENIIPETEQGFHFNIKNEFTYLAPGVYELISNNEKKKICVNTSREESDFSQMITFPDEKLNILSSGQEMENFIKELNGSAEISYLFILLAVLFFIFESMLSR